MKTADNNQIRLDEQALREIVKQNPDLLPTALTVFKPEILVEDKVTADPQQLPHVAPFVANVLPLIPTETTRQPVTSF